MQSAEPDRAASTPSARTVLLLFGGRSAEHEISVLSARFVIDSLDRTRFRPLLCGIDKQGGWHLLREEELPRSADPRQVGVDAAAPIVWPVGGPARLLEPSGAAHPFDVVFPVLHGPFGEDGTLQGMLEMLAVPYVGSGVTASALGMDKLQQKRIFERLELPVAPYVAFGARAWARRRDALLAECAALGDPLFVKPANMGSSLGVSKVAADGLPAAVAHAFDFDATVVVERGLPAVREIELAVLGNEEARATEPGEIVVRHPDGFYSYDAKYIDDGAELRIPAELGASERLALQNLALRAYDALGCAGLARVDLFLSGGQAYVNEVNTMPGFTAISMYPRLWRAAGVDGPALVTRLIELGLERHSARACLRGANRL